MAGQLVLARRADWVVGRQPFQQRPDSSGGVRYLQIWDEITGVAAPA
jgi:hypothetical protein